MDVFTALADPTRRGVLELLRQQERAAGELGDAFPKLSQPAMSRHLRVLREAGLVNVRRDEQRRVYSLRAEGLAELDEWIARYRPFWQLRLDALEKHLDQQAKSARSTTNREKL
jgi:DNA-binding transcriptional ArsR family regulator